MADALKRAGTHRPDITPQNEQADPRQEPNSAGGWTFKTSAHARLHRFLTLGTEGGTYYTSEKTLTRENAHSVVTLANAHDPELIAHTVAVSMAGRAPRNNPALFTLAAAAGSDPEAAGAEVYRARALKALPDVARTGGHLLDFISYAELFRGWGPALVKAVGRWYVDKDPAEVAYQVLKYKQRNGWAQRDGQRLSHFGRVPVGPQMKALCDYVMKGQLGEGLPELVYAADACHKTTLPEQWAGIIGRNPSLTWEMLPSEALREAAVWDALLPHLPATALLRNLPRLTRLGLLTSTSQATAQVTARLTNPHVLGKARIHPIAVLLALKTYALGHSLRGDSTWQPVQRVVDALDAGFYAAYPSVEPSGKRIMDAVDVSGSMGGTAAGFPFTAREVAAAMALVTARSEPQSSLWGFTHELTELPISPRQRLDDVIRTTKGLPFGSTDCALPMVYAARHNLPVDVFRITTDNETWYGDIHPHQALKAYRQKTGIDTRLQVLAVTATDFTIADPADPRQIDVAGFDKDVPGLLASHARGDI